MNSTDGAISFDAYINNSQFKSAIDEMVSGIRQLSNETVEQTRQMDKAFQSVGAMMGAYFTAEGFKSFGTELIKVRGQFEQMGIALETMLGSKGKADQLMGEVTRLAATTPFTLQEVGTATKMLLAYGDASDTVVGTVRRLGDIAAGVGADMNRLTLAYGQVMTAGVLRGQELRQFTEAGVPLIRELANVLKIDQSAVADFVESGKVGFADVKKAIENLTGAGGQFENMMAKQSKSITGMISNLEDAWSQMLNSMGESNEGILKGGVEALIKLVQNWETVVKTLKSAVVVFGAYKAAVMLTSVANTIAANSAAGVTLAEQLQMRATIMLESAQQKLNTTMKMNPYVAIASAILAVVAIIGIFKDKQESVLSSTERLKNANDQVNKSLGEEKGKIEPLIQTLQNQSLSLETRKQAYDTMKEQYPTILKNLSLEESATRKLTDNYKDYLNILEQTLRARNYEAELGAAIATMDEKNALVKAKQAEYDQKAADARKYAESKNVPNVEGAVATATMGISLQLTTLKEEADIATNAVNAIKGKIGEMNTEADKTGGNKVVESVQQRIARLDSEIKKNQELLQTNKDNADEYIKIQKKIKDLQSEKEGLTGKPNKSAMTEQLRDDMQMVTDELAKKKKLYEEYYLWVELRGKDVADQMYSELIAGGDSYSQFIQKQIDTLEAKKKRTPTEEKTLDKYKSMQVSAQTDDESRALATFNKELTNRLALHSTLIEKARVLEKEIAAMDAAGETKSSRRMLVEQMYMDNLQAQAEEAANTYDELSKQYMSYEQKKQDAYVRYEKERKALIDKGNVDAAKERDKAYKEELAQIDEQAGLLKDKMKLVGIDISEMSIENIKKYLAALKEIFKNVNLPESAKEQIDGYFKTLENEIGKQDLTKLFKDYRKASNNVKTATTPENKSQATIDQLIAEGKLLDGITGKFQGVSQAAGQISDALRPFDAQLADDIQKVGEVADGFANISKSIKSGDMTSVATGVYSMLLKIGEGIAKNSKYNKQIQAEEDAREARAEITKQTQELISNELRTQLDLYEKMSTAQKLLNGDILKDAKKLIDEAQQKLMSLVVDPGESWWAKRYTVTNNDTGVSTVHEAVDPTIQNLMKYFNSTDVQEVLDKALQFNMITQEDYDAAMEYIQIIKDGEEELAQLQKQRYEALTGTTVSQLTDMIAEMFQNGKYQAKDFADTFQKLMSNAMLQVFKIKALEEPLQKWFDEFGKGMETRYYTQIYWIDYMKRMLQSIGANAEEMWNQLEELFPEISNLGDPSASNTQTTLAGAFQGLTEETGSLLAGQFNAMRVTTAETAQNTRDALIHLSEIATNSRYLALLVDINNSLKLQYGQNVNSI